MTDLSGDRIRAMQRLTEQAALNAATHVHLVPSENRVSQLVQHVMRSDWHSRYLFNVERSESSWFYPSAEPVAQIEEWGCSVASRLLDAAFVNLRPVSGLNAMLIALAALGGVPGTPIIHVSEKSGGHYATPAVARRFGLIPLAVEFTDGMCFEESELLAYLKRGVRLIYVDLANATVWPDLMTLSHQVEHLCSTHQLSRPYMHFDASHWLGLIAGRQLGNPLRSGFDSFGGSTHKSFPGPQKGVLATNDQSVAEAFSASQFFLVSSHHLGSTVGLCFAMAEFELLAGSSYAPQTVANARAFESALSAEGLEIQRLACRAGRDPAATDTHQVWARSESLGVPTDVAARRLHRAGIMANFLPDFRYSGGYLFRFGLAEATHRGLSESGARELAGLVSAVVRGTLHEGAVSASLDRIVSEFAYPYDVPV